MLSKAREIAEERLAKGEISEEEFEKIVSRLAQSKNRDTEYSAETSSSANTRNDKATEKQHSSDDSKYVLYGIGAVVALVFFSYVKYGNTLDEQRSKCYRDPNISNSSCDCVIRTMKDDVSFLVEMPLFGGIFRPDDEQAFKNKIASQCR